MPKVMHSSSYAPQLLAYSLSFKRLHVEVVGFGRHDEKHNHCNITLMNLSVSMNTNTQSQMNIFALIGARLLQMRNKL